eukprot:scaffold647993_cov48-Prasinocladus_malaysianus.AAC.1
MSGRVGDSQNIRWPPSEFMGPCFRKMRQMGFFQSDGTTPRPASFSRFVAYASQYFCFTFMIMEDHISEVGVPSTAPTSALTNGSTSFLILFLMSEKRCQMSLPCPPRSIRQRIEASMGGLP